MGSESFNAACIKPIPSYSKRQGRMTDSQKKRMQQKEDPYRLFFSDTAYDWSEVFGNKHSVVCDVGFGMGHALCAQAKAHPELNFVAIDVYEAGVAAFLILCAREGVENIRVHCGDAVPFIQTCCPQQGFMQLQCLFPDPWPKKRHHKRRLLLQKPFVDACMASLVSGGIFWIATDWVPYAEDIAPCFSARSDCTLVDRSFCAQPIKSKYHQRGDRLGHTVTHFYYQVA